MTRDDFRQQFPSFAAIRDVDLDTLLGALETSEAQKGSDVISAGRKNSNLYLIRDGRLQVSLDSGGQCTVLGEFGPGQWLGEMGMIEPETAGVARVSAVEDCVLLKLSHADFMALRRSDVSLTSVLLQVFCESLAERLRCTMQLVYEDESETDTRGDATMGWFLEVARQVMGIAARTGT